MIEIVGKAAKAIGLQWQNLLREKAFIGGVWTTASDATAKPIAVTNPDRRNDRACTKSGRVSN